MQAIITRYLGPTTHRGPRIKATCERGSITVADDPALSGEAAHRVAVDALCATFDAEDVAYYGKARSGSSPRVGATGWASFAWIAGGLPQNMRDSYAFVIDSHID